MMVPMMYGSVQVMQENMIWPSKLYEPMHEEQKFVIYVRTLYNVQMLVIMCSWEETSKVNHFMNFSNS